MSELFTVCENDTAGAEAVYSYLFNTDKICFYAAPKRYDEAALNEIHKQASMYSLIAKKDDCDSPFFGLSERSCTLREDNCECEVEIADDMILVKEGKFSGVVLKGTFRSYTTEYGESDDREYERTVYISTGGEEGCAYLYSNTTVYGHDGEESSSSCRVDYRLERKE